MICFAIVYYLFMIDFQKTCSVYDDRKDVGLADDRILFRADLDLSAAVLANDDFVTGLQEHSHFDTFDHSAGTDGDDLRDLRLLLGGSGQQDATLGVSTLFFGVLKLL